MFGDSQEYQLLNREECFSVNDVMLAQIAHRLSRNGVVQLICMSPARAERLTQAVAEPLA